MNPVNHPKHDDKGRSVTIHRPHTLKLDGFNDASAVVTITPGATIPGELNGILFVPWMPPTTCEGWARVEGQIQIEEPRLQPVGNKEAASGVVIIEPDFRLWAVSPTNGFGGYRNTFPKGKHEHNLPLQANAIKEAYEEAGLKVEIIGIIGDAERNTSVTRYYLARRVGGSPSDVGWESQAVHLVPVNAIGAFFDSAADRKVVSMLQEALSKE